MAPSAPIGPGEILNNKYEKVRLLGSGNFGQAWLCVSKASGRSYVVKEMKMTAGLSQADRDRSFNEVTIIKSCSHANIIRYKEFFITGGDLITPPALSIVMEFAENGDLNQLIKRRRTPKYNYFPEATVRNYFVQITFALQYLHKKSILHRDLKTQNIFMAKNGMLKLGDFGISRTLSHENDFATTGIGTPQYLSPEICRQQKYDYKSDIWSLGCVLYEMCALRPAFPGKDWAVLIGSILKAKYSPLPPQYSSGLVDMAKVMLRPEPCRRPTALQIVNASILKEDVHSYLNFTANLSNAQVNSGSGEINPMAPEAETNCSSGSSAAGSIASI